MQKLEHERYPIRKFIERYHDSNEEDQLLGDQKEEIFKEHQHALDSENKPSVKRIVRHKIENNEVKHPANSNVIDKIFRKEYSKLFKNDTTEGLQQNDLDSKGIQSSENQEKGKVINNIFSSEQSNLFESHQSNSGDISNINADTNSVKDSGMTTNQKKKGPTLDSGRNFQKISVIDEMGIDTISNHKKRDSSLENVNHNKEHNFLGQKVGSEVMSQSLQDSIHNQGTSFESTFEDKSTNNEVAKEEYSLGNEVHDYYDDYSQAHSNSHVYDDYYENKEYGVNYEEKDEEFNNIVYDAKVDILDDRTEGEKENNKNELAEADEQQGTVSKEQSFDVSEIALKRDFNNYETEFEADLRKRSQKREPIQEEEDSNLISNVDMDTEFNEDESLKTNNQTLFNVGSANSSKILNSKTKTHSNLNGNSSLTNDISQLEHISNLEIDHKLKFTIKNQTKVKIKKHCEVLVSCSDREAVQSCHKLP